MHLGIKYQNPHMHSKFKCIRLVTGALPICIHRVQLLRLHLGVVQGDMNGCDKGGRSKLATQLAMMDRQEKDQPNAYGMTPNAFM